MLWMASGARPVKLLGLSGAAVLSLLLASAAPTPVGAQPPTPAPTAAPAPALKDVPRKLSAADIRVQAGYKIEPVVVNLSVATTLAFDGADLLIGESGWQQTAEPRVLRLSLERRDGSPAVVAADGLEMPVTGLLVRDGRLYVSHKGKVSVAEGATGAGGPAPLRDIVTDLPSKGDHQNNTLALGPDGKLYLAQGTVTNSAVVGEDNYVFGWLPEEPGVHEIPCKDVALTGQSFETGDPLRRGGPRVKTGAYKPFGTPGEPGEVVKGDVKCGGSVVRFNPDGSGFELVAWGLRNPFGLRFDRAGQLWATYHGADVRGSRPIFNDPDYLVRVEQDAWYGWPEFFDGRPVTDGAFDPPGFAKPTYLWKEHPPLAKAFATFPTHEGANGLDFSPGGAFGFAGDAFVAMFGTFAPVTTGINAQPVGFRVARVDMASGRVHDFASNVLPGPAYLNQQGGFSRPSDVAFAPDGSLYVVDWGHSTLTPEGLKLTTQTGVVWRIYHESMAPERPNGPIVVPSAPVPETRRRPEVRNVPETWRLLAPTLLMALGGVAALALLTWGGVALTRRARRGR